ncbi:Alkaline phosphatase synthesis transcriptional regulatory protein PhoP [Paenibacillus konkukensis]|uniref:Alkaline phosphatase synthesis transcriptional regulatory protein PhoP n=1 Tax=Paenibacillus konkukensis TaxID=2020716 RepID=A0ABY4RFB8_9BACL|nr:response regulator transcription factor [Paenibacillus konkukensis]UQZ81271.1 Alkaline phosphatase synthesis transcriptional regulatory protein PhoP [Paenibacillus konkukensis]
MVKILVIEDDADIQELLREFLSAQNYEVDAADDGVNGIRMLKDNSYDLVLLDVMMPNLDGYNVCKMIRGQSSSLPIVMLTALDDEAAQIKGFELGIDDYITKPFSFNILIKRVEAVLRRAKADSASGVIVFKEVAVDREGFIATVGGNKIELTVKEFAILVYLLDNRGRAVSREALLDHAWGYDYYGDARIVDTHVKNLRKKLGVPYIQTVKGIGYKFDEQT